MADNGIALRACAKINWALDIAGLREDGYHLLDMVMQSIDLCDELTLEPAGDVTLTVNGAPEAWEGNLILKAARALIRHTGEARGARLALVKHIPERAGLGGGSADCAATLLGLNRLWGLELPRETLLRLGEGLGADVPFCLTGGLARVQGIGEVIGPAPAAPEIPLVILRAGDGLSTQAVFRLWDDGCFPKAGLDAPALLDALAARDLPRAARLCANALTAPAKALMPEIAAVIDHMKALGAPCAFMTGSGSAVVGAFDTPEAARRAAAQLPGSLLTRTLPRLPDMP